MVLRSRARRGVALVWLMVVLLALIALIGFSLDVSYCLWAARQLQTAADASALAGVAQVQNASAARQAAQDIALANTVAGSPVRLDSNSANDPLGDIVVGTFDQNTGVFTPTLNSPNAVKVVARRSDTAPHEPLPLFFGPLFGVNTVNLSRSAVAMWGFAPLMQGLLILNPNNQNALTLKGGANLVVTNGTIQVDSSNTSAVNAGNNTFIDATTLNVVGGAPPLNLTGTLNTNAPFVPDPLKSLPIPTWNPAADNGSIKISSDKVANLQPGYYSGGIQASGQAVINMAPGIYILNGIGLDITAGATVNAGGGVCIYITGTGHVDLSGSGVVTLVPPDPKINTFAGTSTYNGIAIFQDPNDQQAASLTGTGNTNIGGAVYLPGAYLTLSGSSSTFNQTIIADTVYVTGNTIIDLTTFGGTIPSTRRVSWLVQ